MIYKKEAGQPKSSKEKAHLKNKLNILVLASP